MVKYPSGNTRSEYIIPDSVKSIGKRAFFSCVALTSITINNLECVIYDDGDTICSGYDDYNNRYYDGDICGYKNSTAQAYARKYGDINLDGVINISDVVAINLYILNQKTYSLEDKAIANADCVKDNVINTSDSTILMNYTAEIIDVSELGK